MISVAMALYKSRRFIKDQLESIRLQSVPVDEVVMVDDGSGDGTVAWVEAYVTRHRLINWRIIRHKENKGYIDTFYDAIFQCSGDIIILCDHDDIWLRDKVSIIKKAFDEHPAILALATSFIQINELNQIVPVKQKRNHANNNLIRRKVRPGSLNPMSFYDVAVYNISPGCTCAFRSSLKDSLRTMRRILPHDWTIMVLAACRDGLYYLDRITTKYRIYRGNTIGLGHESRYEVRVKDVVHNYDEKKEIQNIVRIVKGKRSEEYRYAARITHIFALRKDFLVHRKPVSAVKAFIRSLPYGRLYESVAMDILTTLFALKRLQRVS